MLQNTSFLPRAASLSILVAVATTGLMPLRPAAAAAPAQEPRRPITTKPVITYMPSVDDFFPAASKNNGEWGVVTILACYGPNGRMTTTEVKESSRHPRLDEAAQRFAKQVRVRPGTQDGVIVSGCLDLPIEFPKSAPRA